MLRIEFVDNGLATDPEHAYVAHVTQDGQPVATVPVQGVPKDAGWQGAIKALAAQLA